MRRQITQRPFKALRRQQAPKPARATDAEHPLESTRAVSLPDRPRRVPPPSAPSTISKPRPSTPAFVLKNTNGSVEGARRELSLRQRRTLRGTPTATCDLHGYDAARARQTLEHFLRTERARGRTLVLVIVGKGLHSPGKRPVLRSEIVDWLTEPPLGALVLAFSTAPRELGGTGALVVFLA